MISSLWNFTIKINKCTDLIQLNLKGSTITQLSLFLIQLLLLIRK